MRAFFVRPASLMLATVLVLVPAWAAFAQEGGWSAVIDTSTDAAQARAIVDASPLAPAPTTSPRQTLTSFRTFVRNSQELLKEAVERSVENDAYFDTPELSRLKASALEQLDKAASTLDLSDAPLESRRTLGISAALQLQEIFDRIAMPEPEAIPGEAEVDAGAAPNGWTIPDTQIRMVRLEGADGEPLFLFSSETVHRLSQFYAQVRDLPQRSADGIDFYQSFVVGPGLSMPMELYRHVLELPEWMLEPYFEQAVWQWMAFLVLTVMVCLVVFVLLRWEMRRPRSVNAALRSLKRMISPLAIILVLGLYRWLNDNFINLTGTFLSDVEVTVVMLQAIALAVAAVLAFNALAVAAVSLPRIGKETLDASLIRLVLRVIGIGVAGYILFLAAARIGVPLYGIIASLGVGGLALALAVRPTLENFIGGIILYADRPVRVGDFCKFGDKLGTVEAIGLRSTKVRGLDRTLVTVQNAEFSQMPIINYTRRDSNLMQTTIGLRYETTARQLEAIIDRTAEMLRADERVQADTVRVCFRGFGEWSLDLEVRAYINSADWSEFLKIQEELFFRVMEIVDKNGADFALPSQTNYPAGDRLRGEPAGALQAEAEAT